MLYGWRLANRELIPRSTFNSIVRCVVNQSFVRTVYTFAIEYRCGVCAMRSNAFVAAIAAGLITTSVAAAQPYSSAAMSPTPLPANGIVEGSYPAGDKETSYFFAVDLKAGDLASQISFLGRPSADKKLEFSVLNAKGREVASYYIMSGLDANQEAARVFAIDNRGSYILRVRLSGPEATTFKIAVAGSAFVPTAAAKAAGLSSFLAPALLPKNGVIAGTFPGGDRKLTYYYFAVNLKAGDLLSQIGFSGRKNVDKWLELALLAANGREVKSHYVMGGIDASSEATRSLPVDATGAYVLRVGMKGPEGTTYRVELGGSAFQAGM